MLIPQAAGVGDFRVCKAGNVVHIGRKLALPFARAFHYLRHLDLLQALAVVGKEDDDDRLAGMSGHIISECTVWVPEGEQRHATHGCDPSGEKYPPRHALCIAVVV